MFFAAASTIIAVFENIITFAMELTGCSRIKSVICNLVVILVLSVPCILGFNVWSGISPLVLHQPVWMGMEEVYRGSKQRTGNPIPKMGKNLCIVYPAFDRIVYLRTGIYYDVLGV